MYCYHYSSSSRFIFSFWLICFLLLINLGSFYFSVTLVIGVVGFLFNLKKKQPSLVDPISMHIEFEGSTWNHLIILNVETFPYIIYLKRAVTNLVTGNCHDKAKLGYLLKAWTFLNGNHIPTSNDRNGFFGGERRYKFNSSQETHFTLVGLQSSTVDI